MTTEERVRIPSKTTIRDLVNFPTRSPIQVKIYEYDKSETKKSKKKTKKSKEKSEAKDEGSSEYLSMELKALSDDLKRRSSTESVDCQVSDFKQTMERLSSLEKTNRAVKSASASAIESVNNVKIDVSAITECKFDDISLVSAELAIELSGIKTFFHYFKSNTKEHITAMLDRLEQVEKRCHTYGLFELSTRLQRSLSFFKRDAAKLDTITSDTFRLRRQNQLDECIKLFLAIANIADIIY